MRRAVAVAVGGVVMALGAPGGASAAITNPTCGQTVTQNVKLEADLTDCAGDGLVLGKSGLTIDLNGHSITTAVGNAGRSAIGNPNGYGRLTLRNGTITYSSVVSVGAEGHSRFSDLYVRTYGRNAFLSTGGYNTVTRVIAQSDQTGFNFGAGHNRVTDSQVTQAYGGIFIAGEGHNVVEHNATTGIGGQAMVIGGDRNRVANNTIEADFTLSVGGNDNLVVDNQILRDFSGLRISGSRNRVLDNVEFRGGDTDAWTIRGGADTVVARNVIRGRQSRIIGATGVVFRDNALPQGGLDVDAASTGARIIGNSFHNIDGDGLRVQSSGSLVRNNTANNNAALGINAFPGVIDGGGNHASGNGDPRQCVGVVCQP